jgi:iron complex outermembrane recepter protein
MNARSSLAIEISRALAISAVASSSLGLSSIALAAPNMQDFKRMSVEELMDIEVYSASRRLEPSQSVPSAIYVLTAETIRRSRVTSIPEALRLVPGVQVARVDANKWAISMRGFNSREANKLLVLMDGRSIYDPLFSGVLWESQDAMLENIDRIEVIRGPGGTLWGANAFNGIINIISKNARDTLGGLITGSLGDEERYQGAIRYGFSPAERHALRLYLKAYGHEPGYSDLAPPHDAARMTRGGFRWDWKLAADDDLRVSGDFYDATTGVREDPTLVQDVDHEGKNVLARWNKSFSAVNAVQLQFYYDHVVYESFGFDQKRSTYDVEAQQTLRLFARNELVWGGGYRSMRDDTLTAFPGFVDVLPPRRHDEVSTIFAQDTIALLPGKLNLVLGLKFEKTDYAESDWLPSIRVAWTPSEEQTWWLAVSDAARTPSRLESDLTFINTLRLGSDFSSEHVRAYEAGQRQLLSTRFWYDVAVFYNDYSDLRSGEQGGRLRNLMEGYTYGAEVAVRFEPSDRWQLEATYTYLKMRLDLDAASTASRAQPGFIEGLAAPHQASLRSELDLFEKVGFDVILRYVDELESLSYPAYTELDMGVSWRPTDKLELSVVGQNLLHDHHPEQDFAFSASGMPTEVERRVYAKATLSF